jgi:hypothetical protein
MDEELLFYMILSSPLRFLRLGLCLFILSLLRFLLSFLFHAFEHVLLSILFSHSPHSLLNISGESNHGTMHGALFVEWMGDGRNDGC